MFSGQVSSPCYTPKYRSPRVRGREGERNGKGAEEEEQGIERLKTVELTPRKDTNNISWGIKSQIQA